MTEWIYCRNRLPPRNIWVYVCLVGGTKAIAKRTLFLNNWKFTGKFKESILQNDMWLSIENAPLAWRKDIVNHYGYTGIPIDD